MILLSPNNYYSRVRVGEAGARLLKLVLEDSTQCAGAQTSQVLRNL